MLPSFGTWQCGCENERRFAVYVFTAYAHGCLEKRMHYAQAMPEGVEAWELTDSAIELIRAHLGGKVADRTIKARQWYREHSSTLQRAQEQYRRKTGREFDDTIVEFGKRTVPSVEAVFLDGHKQDHVIAAGDDWIERYVMDGKNHVIDHGPNGDPFLVTERVNGKVVIQRHPPKSDPPGPDEAA
jgi:hypothetical protein